MNPSPLGRFARFPAGVFLTLLAMVAVAPTSVRAGCGHYVLSGLGHSGASALDDLKILADVPAVDHGATPAQRPDRPCSGPTCSGQPSRPDAPNLPAPPSGDRWCDTTTVVEMAGPGTQRTVVDAPSTHPVKRPASIERPPRTLPTFPSV